jgi:uncharacterized protein (DUF305 family)
MILRRVACGISAVLAIGGLTACTSDPPEDKAPVIAPGKPGDPVSTVPPGQVSAPPVAPANANDIEYMKRMIEHHQQAIEMAQLAPERAGAEQVKLVADRIAAAQGPEIQAMNAWLKKHGQPTVAPGAHGGHAGHDPATMPGMATQAQLDALRAAKGAEFDRQFLTLMITHHDGALTMAREVQTKGSDENVQLIADEVIATQTAEINRLRAITVQ